MFTEVAGFAFGGLHLANVPPWFGSAASTLVVIQSQACGVPEVKQKNVEKQMGCSGGRECCREPLVRGEAWSHSASVPLPHAAAALRCVLSDIAPPGASAPSSGCAPCSHFPAWFSYLCSPLSHFSCFLRKKAMSTFPPSSSPDLTELSLKAAVQFQHQMPSPGIFKACRG